MNISILIPIYNEEKTIILVIEKIKKLKIKHILEIIIINDGSTDKTKQVLLGINKTSTQKSLTIKIVHHKNNQGKGAAIKTGLKVAKGEYIIIQDADLEYDPIYIPSLFRPILDKEALVVYGTRLKRLPNFKKEEKAMRFRIHYFGNKFLSLITSIFYGQWISDMETGYKVIPRRALEKIDLQSKGFEFEPEVTAKLLKQGYRIHEVPIRMMPRGYDEGKKLNTIRDGFKAFWTIIKHRF